MEDTFSYLFHEGKTVSLVFVDRFHSKQYQASGLSFKHH